MKKKISIVDYGLGNTVSAQQSFVKALKLKSFDAEVIITKNPKDIYTSTHIVLPGQGAFISCMQGLRDVDGMIDTLEEYVLQKKLPFMGICVGMQLLADRGFEKEEHKGLGWIAGSIKEIPSKELKLPHMGWNSVAILKNNKNINLNPKNQDFYFVHSYYFDCLNKDNVVGLTNYGINFPSIVAKENIYGVQFHPEKSSDQGIELISKFLSL